MEGSSRMNSIGSNVINEEGSMDLGVTNQIFFPNIPDT